LPRPMLLTCLLSACQLLGRPLDLDRVRITSTWIGLGEPADTILTIRREGSQFRRSDGVLLPPERLQRLQDALEEPMLAGIDLADLGVTRAWLDEHADEAWQVTRPSVRRPAPNLEALFKASFRDLHLVEQVIRAQYQSCHTDDFPALGLEVTRKDGTLNLVSESQHAFMLPWKLEGPGTATTTWNAHLSHAVAALLPPKATNRSRLTGAGFATRLAQDLHLHLMTPMARLDAENSEGPALRLIGQDFRILDAEMSFGFSSNLVRGKVRRMGSGAYSDTYLGVSLGHPAFPGNFSLNVILACQPGIEAKVRAFQAAAGGCWERTLSLPWLRAHLVANPATMFELWYVEDGSVSACALEEFQADMASLGRAALGEDLARNRKGACLLTSIGPAGMPDSGKADILILPDGRTILWKTRNETILGHACTALPGARDRDGEHLLGAVLSPEGKPVVE
jgi:hypothetical protein